MKGKWRSKAKKYIPYRRIARTIREAEKKLKISSSLTCYWKSYFALRAGLWHDDFFVKYVDMLSNDLDMETLMLSMHYKRLKYGWSGDELQEFSLSRNGVRYRQSLQLQGLLASLYHEISDFDNAHFLLKKLLKSNPSAFSGYLGVSALAAQYGGNSTSSCVKDDHRIKALFSRFLTFRDYYRSRLSGKKLAIVGNGPSGKGQSNGQLIDSHDQVFRFNNFAITGQYERDYGRKTTVWVRTPSIDEVIMRSDICPEGIIISTPLILYTRNGNWKWMLDLTETNTSLVLFDIDVFRSLVQILDAPPSAGLLTLCNLAKYGHEGSFLVGFDFNSGAKSHYFDSQRAGNRHNWAGELKIFKELEDRPSFTGRLDCE